MAKSQATHPQIRALQSSSSSPLVVEPIPLPNAGDPLYCDVSTGTQRPLVPREWRRTVFNSLHSLSHPGIRATQKLITARFVWPGVNADVRRWTRACVQCQRAKIQRHSVAPLSSFPVPDARFDVVHIDLVGPLPPSRGFTYLPISTEIRPTQRQTSSLQPSHHMSPLAQDDESSSLSTSPRTRRHQKVPMGLQ
ncbi:Uncharacterized protein K02A2.6, partial [Geodia barretti]